MNRGTAKTPAPKSGFVVRRPLSSITSGVRSVHGSLSKQPYASPDKLIPNSAKRYAACLPA